MPDDLITTTIVQPVADAASKEVPLTAEVGKEKPVTFGDFRDQISPELRTNEFLKDKSKPDDIVKAALEANKKNTDYEAKLKTAIVRPGEGATKEQVDAYQASIREAVGVPSDVSGYKINVSDDFKKIPGSEELLDFYKSSFLESEVPSAAAQKAWAKIESRVTSAIKAQQEAVESQKNKAVTDLKDALKGEYEPTMKLASEFGNQFWGPDTWKKIEASGLGNDKDFVISLRPLAQAYQQGRILKGESGQTKVQTAAKALFPNFN